jgi:hypothetical protein
LESSWSKIRLAGLSAAAVPFAVAFVVVDGLAPRGAIVASLVVAPVEVPVAALLGVDGWLEGCAVDGDGMPVEEAAEGVAEGAVEVSAALASVMPVAPIVAAIKPVASLRVILSMMGSPRGSEAAWAAAGTCTVMQGPCPR